VYVKARTAYSHNFTLYAYQKPEANIFLSTITRVSSAYHPRPAMRTMHKSFEDKTVISFDVIDAIEQGLKNLRDLDGRLRSQSRFWFPT
jgi:hypothetical protein